MLISDTYTQQLLDGISGKRIAIIGDVMLDQYYWGNVTRMSPEAPVPVVEVSSESLRLGGAANVAHNVASLGAEPLLFGVVGDDQNGLLLKSIMKEAGYWIDGIVTDPARPTTIKTRVIAHNQHVVRFDRENTSFIDDSLSDRLIDSIAGVINSADGVILQDYNKGIFTETLISRIIEKTLGASVPVTVDPKFNNFFHYKQVSVFKPNRREIEQAFGIKLFHDSDFEIYGKEILHRLDAGSVLITRGEHGMTLVEKGGEVTHIPTRARAVADVSGAGDTVIATLTVMLTAGAGIKESATIANFAGGVVCEEVGIVPVEQKKLFDAISRFNNASLKKSEPRQDESTAWVK